MKGPFFMVFLLLLAGNAHAQQAPQGDPANKDESRKQERSAAAGATRPSPSPLFDRLDRNGDGYLSEQELWSELGERSEWAALDADRDGRISPAEFIVMR